MKREPIFFTFSLVLAVSFSVFLGGCNRELNEGSSVVRIATPKNIISSKLQKKGVSANAAPDVLLNRLECWGVNVTAEDIVTTPSFCGPNLGTFSGFVPGGADLTVEVTQGENRNISLFLYLAEEGKTTCPSWDATFISDGGNFYSRTYEVATTNGVQMDQETTEVSMSVNFPGLNANVSTNSTDTGCVAPGGSVKALLFADGSIDTEPALDDPSNDSIIKSSDADVSFVGVSSVSGKVIFAGQEFSVPPYISSVTRKPDGDGSFFGLAAGGQVVKIDSTGTEVDISNSCPFASCTVPVWLESISAGFGKHLYGKDYSGQVYEIASDGTANFLGVNLGPHVRHFAMY